MGLQYFYCHDYWVHRWRSQVTYYCIHVCNSWLLLYSWLVFRNSLVVGLSDCFRVFILVYRILSCSFNTSLPFGYVVPKAPIKFDLLQKSWRVPAGTHQIVIPCTVLASKCPMFGISSNYSIRVCDRKISGRTMNSRHACIHSVELIASGRPASYLREVRDSNSNKKPCSLYDSSYL